MQTSILFLTASYTTCALTGERDNLISRLRYRYQPFCRSSLLPWMDEKRSRLGKKFAWLQRFFVRSYRSSRVSFFFSYRSRLGLWRNRSRGYWEKEHGERNGTWVSGTTGTVTEWTSELLNRHFIIAVFLKKALARFTLWPRRCHTLSPLPPPNCGPVYFFIPTFFCIYIFVFIYSSNGSIIQFKRHASCKNGFNRNPSLL